MARHRACFVRSNLYCYLYTAQSNEHCHSWSSNGSIPSEVTKLLPLQTGENICLIERAAPQCAHGLGVLGTVFLGSAGPPAPLSPCSQFVLVHTQKSQRHSMASPWEIRHEASVEWGTSGTFCFECSCWDLSNRVPMLAPMLSVLQWAVLSWNQSISPE